ncbi:MAG: aspartate kinase [Bacteroidota bacterium]
MKVFKFGGASLKNSEAVENMASIIEEYAGESLIIVVSAMAKNTNLLEYIVRKKLQSADYQTLFDEFENFHSQMTNDLFKANAGVKDKIRTMLIELKSKIEQDLEPSKLYDNVVVYGELLSSMIVAEFVNASWVDARDYIKTDEHHQNANINWDKTQKLIVSDLKQTNGIVVTQGFIGSTDNGESTTLGREGSDFTAAIFATCLEVDSVTVWKDVPGILNGDPKKISNTEKFDELPYKEAAEMTYYGASVIHPKTIKPLANQNIPLYVKSFSDPAASGTIIHDCSFKPLPTIIIKDNQCLISFKVIDYSFINEHNLSVIFRELATADIQISMMQNSAVSFSIVVDNDLTKVEALVGRLKSDFQIRYNTGLHLLTIKNYTNKLIQKYQKGNRILLEQTSRNNYRSLMAKLD